MLIAILGTLHCRESLILWTWFDKKLLSPLILFVLFEVIWGLQVFQFSTGSWDCTLKLYYFNFIYYYWNDYEIKVGLSEGLFCISSRGIWRRQMLVYGTGKEFWVIHHLLMKIIIESFAVKNGQNRETFGKKIFFVHAICLYICNIVSFFFFTLMYPGACVTIQGNNCIVWKPRR